MVIQHKSGNHIYFARVSGCSSAHIVVYHLFPAIAGEVSILATLDTAGIVIINSLTRTREQSPRGVAVIHDEIRVRLVALKRHTNNHLPQRGTRQTIRTGQRLAT